MAITTVIKYEGDNSTFIWKHPTVNFNSMTQLIVYESQEAVFMMNGMIMDTFGPGKYNLDTESLPILGKFVDNLVYGDSSFTADVYFINQTVQMALKWGTSPKVRFIEPNTGIPLEIGASGNLNLRVKDSKKLLVKLVGTTSGVAWDSKDSTDLRKSSDSSNLTKSLQDLFRPLINTAFRVNFAPIVKENNINIIEIDQHVEQLAKPMHEKINEGFEEYGLSVVDFYITDIVLPEEDRNFKRIKDIMASSYLGVKEAQVEADIIAARRLAELEQEQTATAKKKMELERELLQAQLDAQKTKLSGLAEAEVMAAQGVTKKDYLQADVQKAYAEGLGKAGSNGGTGPSIAGDMMQMQMGMMAANAMSGQMKEMMSGMTENDAQPQQANVVYCPNCGAQLPAGAKFCMSCGQPLIASDKCPNCGSEIPEGAKFCLNCGTKIGE
ncbi:MAG: SPFH domain-containing protein [Erysipelotrichaceae bacterium]|nr:SPFH domain-containing protein [Erysipelotrichaceae bacterium]